MDWLRVWVIAFLALEGVLGVTAAASPAAAAAAAAAATVDPENRPSCADGTSPPNRVNTTERLHQLRQLMADSRYNVQAYIIPMDDEHQSEYVSPHDARIRFISGFSGSAGLAVVTADRAALWTDARYFLQAEAELDCNWELMRNGTTPAPPSELEWLLEHLPRGSAAGGDPKVIAAQDWVNIDSRLRGSSLQMKLVYENLIDQIWTEDRPPRSNESIKVHDLAYAGRRWEEKVQDLREFMLERQLEAVLVTALDEVAWLLNLRGRDIPHTPVFRSYVVVDKDSVHLWAELEKVTEEVRQHLRVDACADDTDCVQLHNYNEVLYNFGAMIREKWKGKILIPSRSTYIDGASFSFYNQVPSSNRVFEVSPLEKLKGIKNEVEIQGMKEAQKRDSVALCEFLAFLEQEIQSGGKWDELTAAAKLVDFRAEQSLFRGTSFKTISAFGSNAAIIHYAPSNLTVRQIDTSSTYLLDSGGQYLDGTTDVTRTMHYGQPTAFQRETYTRVLMGAIDLARLVINSQVRDIQLSVLARRPLFTAGLNYRHGTGHGIGSYLCVHEGPTLISPRGAGHLMEAGQFFSDEPGYYHDGEFGIRLETILFVKERSTKYDFDGPYLDFEPVTLVPFERHLILPDLLSSEQLKWLNSYHRRVQQEVGAVLENQGKTQALDWLAARTAPIQGSHGSGREPSLGFVKSSASPCGQVAALANLCLVLGVVGLMRPV